MLHRTHHRDPHKSFPRAVTDASSSTRLPMKFLRAHPCASCQTVEHVLREQLLVRHASTLSGLTAGCRLGGLVGHMHYKREQCDGVLQHARAAVARGLVHFNLRRWVGERHKLVGRWVQSLHLVWCQLLDGVGSSHVSYIFVEVSKIPLRSQCWVLHVASFLAVPLCWTSTG